MVVSSRLGAVRALVGGRDYGASQFNRAMDARRQPGSSFKPYVYLTALMSGKFTPQTIVVDAPICLGHWCPKNYGGSYGGSMPLVERAGAFAQHGGGAPVGRDGRRRPQAAGGAKIIETARRLGVTAPLPDTQSLPLGADDVSVMDQATAYSAFANGGRRIKPYAAMEIFNSRGDLIYSHDRDGEQPQQVIEPRHIDMLVSMMMKVVEQGTGRARQAGGRPGRRQDRHHQRLQGRLVLRLYRQFRRRGLVRQ